MNDPLHPILKQFKQRSGEELVISGIVAKLVHEVQACSLLDIGAGSCALAKQILDRYPTLHIDAVEPTHVASDDARIHIIKCVVEQLYLSKSYDAALLSHVLGHVALGQRPGLFHEIASHARVTIVVTNAVVGAFKRVQREVWNTVHDDSYFIDVGSLVSRLSPRYVVLGRTFQVDCPGLDIHTAYLLCNVFSPIPLPQTAPPSMLHALQTFANPAGVGYTFQVPQFVLACANERDAGAIRRCGFRPLDRTQLLTHEALWDSFTSDAAVELPEPHLSRG